MINVFEVQETNKMIEESNLDVRTITMGISLLDCCDNDVDVVCDKIYRKITEKAENLVKVGEQIELDYGIPIVNKRISVTPIALVGGSCCKTPEDYVKIAKSLDGCPYGGHQFPWRLFSTCIQRHDAGRQTADRIHSSGSG